MTPRMKALFIQLSMLIGLICVIYAISSVLYFRIDLTEERIYTISEGSQRIVENLSEPVEIKLYFSKGTKDFPLPYKMFGSRVQEVLKELAHHSNGKLQLEIIDPRPDSNEEVLARKHGMQGIPLGNGDEAYLGLVFISGEREKIIPYLDPRKEEFINYDIAEALVKLHQTVKPRLGILSSLPIEANMFHPNQRFFHQQREWSFIQSLRSSFDVEILNSNDSTLPENLNVLILFHPKDLSKKLLFEIDQYLLKGGRLIVAVDPFSRLDLTHQQQAMLRTGEMPVVSSQLELLFSAWGLSFKSDQMLGDLSRPTRINVGGQNTHYPLFLSLSGNDLNRENKITANLKQMLLAEPGWFEIDLDSKQVKAETLIKSTSQSGAIDISLAAFMNPSDLARQIKAEDRERVLAVMLKGHFNSAFEQDEEVQSENPNFLKNSEKESVIVLIGDIDFLHDSNSMDRIPFINQVILRPRNDNINFLINAAEMLGGNEDLITIRTSGKVNRPFTRVIELQQKAQERWKAEEEKLSNELQNLENKLTELYKQKSEGDHSSLAAASQEEIQKFRQEEADVRTRRRLVRQRLREDIESLGRRLIVLNLLVVPGAVSCLGIYVFWRREKKAKSKLHKQFIDPQN